MKPQIPPPLVAAVVALLIWCTHRFLPILPMPFPYKDFVAALIALVGSAVCISGVVSFRRARTTVNPLRPDTASALVVSGVYRFSRNPMYLGFSLLLVSWVVYLAEWSGLLAVGAFMAYMTRFQILLEERALETNFGAAFLEYKQRVRRWL